MKRGLVIFLRVIFVLVVVAVAAYFGARAYYLHGSQSAIQQSLEIGIAPVIGDRSRPFTVVEFFDYRCPHCPVLLKLTDEALDGDPKTKIVLRPAVLRDQDSFKIAAFVLALEKQTPGAGVALHKQIMALSDVPAYETVTAIAQSSGVDVAVVEKNAASDDIKGEIVRNTSFVKGIGFYAVPALVIGDKGFVSRERMPGINELRLMILDAKTRLHIQN